MLDAPGVGLAAPQIGVSLHVFTYHVDDEPGHLINPVLKLTASRKRTTRAACRCPACSSPPRAPPADRDRLQHVRRPGHDRGHRTARPLRPARDRPPGWHPVHRRLDKKQRKLAMKAIREAEWSGMPVPEIKVSPHSTSGSPKGAAPCGSSSPVPRRRAAHAARARRLPPHGGRGGDAAGRARRARQENAAVAGGRARGRAGLEALKPDRPNEAWFLDRLRAIAPTAAR